MPEKHHKYSLIVYLLLANTITWLGWIPGLIIGAHKGYVMPNFDTYATLFANGFSNSQHMLLAIAFTLGVYGPLISGVVATLMDNGWEGLSNLWQRLTKWNIDKRWYITVLVITFMLAGLPVGIFAIVGGYQSSTVTIAYILFVFIAQLMTSGLGEEPGWRGYLLPRLQTRYKDENYIWVLGLIWAIWHYPLVIIQTLSVMQNVTLPQIIITTITSLAGVTMSQILYPISTPGFTIKPGAFS